jgi:hypothetical protein
MRNFTLAFLSFFAFSLGFSQTYTTGQISLLNNGEIDYTAQIDITNEVVTLTLIGPDQRYLGIGFGVQSMTSGGDVLIWLNDGEFKLTDRSFGFPGQPPGEDATGIIPGLDSTQDWTVITNSLDAGQRTIVATRAINTGDSKDYVFDSSDAFINMVWSVGFSYNLSYHGENSGIVMEPVTLGQSELSAVDFKLYPNPSKDNFAIHLSNYASDVQLTVFDVLGKKIVAKLLSGLTSSIDVSKWNNGLYLIRVTSDSEAQTKRFIKQ